LNRNEISKESHLFIPTTMTIQRCIGRIMVILKIAKFS